jgi:hypothetical protein
VNDKDKDIRFLPLRHFEQAVEPRLRRVNGEGGFIVSLIRPVVMEVEMDVRRVR